jgi:hypothetical protein
MGGAFLSIEKNRFIICGFDFFEHVNRTHVICNILSGIISSYILHLKHFIIIKKVKLCSFGQKDELESLPVPDLGKVIFKYPMANPRAAARWIPTKQISLFCSIPLY